MGGRLGVAVWVLLGVFVGRSVLWEMTVGDEAADDRLKIK